MKDLIEREDVIKVINEETRTHRTLVPHYFKIKINQIPSAEKQDEWIPCSERLPEKPNMYMVTDNKGDVVRFVFDDTESSREYWLRCAKAWMPLPEPWKGADKEQTMSKEEALRYWEWIYENIKYYSDPHWEASELREHREHVQAVEWAIKALKEADDEDLIKRKDAIKAVEDVSENYTKEGDREWHPHIDFITQALVQVPSVSSKPKCGEWIDKGWKGDWQFETDGRGNCWHEYECSECGFRNKGSKSNYCPDCGERMTDKDIDVPYKIASDQRDYDSTYEPTYNEQDGSM